MKIEQRHLLQTWRDELGVLLKSHYSRSISIRRLNYLLGIPVILIAMSVASYIFFTINHNPDFWVKMIAGMLLLLGAILTSLQTFLKYSEQAENHRNASARYQSLHHSLDQLLAFPPKDETALAAWCDKLRERWDELNLEVPSVVKEAQERAGYVESGNDETMTEKKRPNNEEKNVAADQASGTTEQAQSSQQE